MQLKLLFNKNINIVFSSTVCIGEAGNVGRVAGWPLCYHRVLLLRGTYNSSEVI